MRQITPVELPPGSFFRIHDPTRPQVAREYVGYYTHGRVVMCLMGWSGSWYERETLADGGSEQNPVGLDRDCQLFLLEEGDELYTRALVYQARQELLS